MDAPQKRRTEACVDKRSSLRVNAARATVCRHASLGRIPNAGFPKRLPMFLAFLNDSRKDDCVGQVVVYQAPPSPPCKYDTSTFILTNRVSRTVDCLFTHTTQVHNASHSTTRTKFRPRITNIIYCQIITITDHSIHKQIQQLIIH